MTEARVGGGRGCLAALARRWRGQRVHACMLLLTNPRCACPCPSCPCPTADEEVDALVKEIEEEKAAAAPQRPAAQQ